MSALGKSLGGLTATLVGGRPPGLPPLPPGLGLPEKSSIAQYRAKAGNVASAGEYQAAVGKANAYNQALVGLLNQQPHLDGAQRTEIYKYYGDDMGSTKISEYNSLRKQFGSAQDFSGQLSQMSPAQMQAEQAAAQQRANQEAQAQYDQQVAQQQAEQQQQQAQQQQQQQAQLQSQQQAALAQRQAQEQQQKAQQAAAPKPTAPATVGPVPKPAEPAPPPTPTVATAGGNIAGQTVTTGGAEAGAGKSRGRRGRVATLLTGLGGALERFG